MSVLSIIYLSISIYLSSIYHHDLSIYHLSFCLSIIYLSIYLIVEGWVCIWLTMEISLIKHLNFYYQYLVNWRITRSNIWSIEESQGPFILRYIVSFINKEINSFKCYLQICYKILLIFVFDVNQLLIFLK